MWAADDGGFIEGSNVARMRLSFKGNVRLVSKGIGGFDQNR